MLFSNRKRSFLVSTLVCCLISGFSQERSVDKLDAKYLNWQNHDLATDRELGASVNKAYRELLGKKTPKKVVVVAVIDGGVDIDHEDLQGKIWVNEDEIPGNNIDDDNNGYIDDIHGWNFIGNKNGENLHYENYEFTRVYSKGNGPFYDHAKKLHEEAIAKHTQEKESIARFETLYYQAKATIKNKTGIEVTSLKDLDGITPEDGEPVMRAKRFLVPRYEQGFSEKGLDDYKKYNKHVLEKYLNPDLNARVLVGDDPTNINDVAYGNPDVKGPRADHGTSVAGIIAAVRDNNLGIDGIATEVRIMCLRSTPEGDERDKDVALAIRYAVNNGADIINMSFGKPISPQKKFVDDAVKLAEEKDVLLIHAAGNDGNNIDKVDSYPSDRYLNAVEATNWINIGASSSTDGDAAAANFSNYGKKHVDLFAPGANIISTDTGNYYSMNDGTSLSAPVVTGVAALVLSYYPDLTSKQLIQLLLESSFKVDHKVLQPNKSGAKPKKVKFNTLSKSGGIVNAFEALNRAESLK
ncbi:MAG TPA: S8 family peptidase [Chryseolinea sp.]